LAWTASKRRQRTAAKQVVKLSSLTKFIADAFFLPAKIVKTTKTQISLSQSGN
jgi:hypothetical protein